MIIEYLSDHPDTISELAGWYVSEWGPYYGDAGPGDARVDLEARLNQEALPIGIVAMEGALAGKGLPAADDGVAINQIEFEDVGAATGLFGGNHGRAGAGEGIENDLLAFRAVFDGIGDHSRHCA